MVAAGGGNGADVAEVYAGYVKGGADGRDMRDIYSNSCVDDAKRHIYGGRLDAVEDSMEREKPVTAA
jgi:hypothetical protein